MKPEKGAVDVELREPWTVEIFEAYDRGESVWWDEELGRWVASDGTGRVERELKPSTAQPSSDAA